MNILFISSQFPNSLEPNRGIFSYQIVREMSRFESIKVIAPLPYVSRLRFLNPLRKYRIQPNVPSLENIENIPVHHPVYNAVPKMGILHYITLYKAIKPLMKAIQADWGIDAVNCHWIFPDGAAVRKVCEELGIPIMLTPLGSDLNRYTEFPLRRWIIEKALQKSDRVSTLNREMYQKCLSLGVSKERLVIISNGVNLAQFIIRDRISARTRLGISCESQVVLFVGSLVPVKGIETMLRAVELMFQTARWSSLRLYVVGSGYLERVLRRLSGDLGLDNTVNFVGPVSHSELVYWMNAADCLCLPSLSEGHPNVVMEALACGTPVVASAVGSIPDFITAASGRLSAPLDYRDLSRNLEECLATRYDRTEIRGHVQTFSWEESAKKYVSELRQIAKVRHV